jgi:hypothetical protein
MRKRLTISQFLAKPGEPPPRDPVLAAAWRKRRLKDLAREDAQREKYEQLMAERRQAGGR